jgi:thiosulfate reductase cytochrome b subunit
MIMIWSGMLIYWANDVYTFTIFGHTFFNFFPAWFNKALNIPFRLAEGMAFHFLFMWFFAINGFLYVLYTAISGEWRKFPVLAPGMQLRFCAWRNCALYTNYDLK